MVKVKAADFNGHSFDGCPFDHIPDWLINAENAGNIQIYPADRDYALWKVCTSKGIQIAEPDDCIVLLNEELYVMTNDEYLMEFFI